LFAAVLGVTAFCVPVLRVKLFLLSPAYLALTAMTLAPWLDRFVSAGAAGAARAAIHIAWVAVLVGSARVVATMLGADDYNHVVDLMVAKLRYLGQRPADPALLSFDVRMLWQGPFATGYPIRLASGLGVLALGVPAAGLISLRSWWRGHGDPLGPVLAAFACALLVLALLVDRVQAVAGVLAPAVTAVTLRAFFADVEMRRWLGIGAGLLAVQAALVWYMIGNVGRKLWYDTGHQAALVEAIRFIRSDLPPGAVIATDYVTSSALLAHTDARVVLQPKYETNRSRRRIERFESAFHFESPSTFAQVLRDEFDADYLLVDAAVLMFTRYEAGVSPTAGKATANTAAAMLLSGKGRELERIPGYRLIATAGGSPPRIRLFELVPP
jgi:hypothetical protein